MSNLVCKNICKSYKEKEVLKDINLTIEQGKIYGLIGRNGVGKTTLLSILTAQNKASAGEVLVDDMPVWENRKALDKLCFSREISSTLLMGSNNFKVKDYLNMAKTFYPNWDQDMADKLLNDFKINTKAKIYKLSKGTLSMVTIIIGLASKADITILDEPVAGLDVVARDKFYKLLIDEQCESNRTFIISTHIIEEAANVFEEVIILHDKSIMIHENTEELLERTITVSGLDTVVDKAVSGLNILKTENIGKSKTATVLLEKGQSFDSFYDVTVQPVSLQNLFIAICKGED